jgi:tRNA pseudouridine55 synthase
MLIMFVWFCIEVVCEGGTYIRKLIVDIAAAMNCCATTVFLQRTAQGPFTLEHCLSEDQWTLENIQLAIQNCEKLLDKRRLKG